MVPAAKLSATNTGTGQVRATETGNDGTFNILQLAPGVYSLTVVKEGFNTVARSGIAIAPDQVSTVDMTITVGSVNTVVQVAANAEMLTTTDATIGQLINTTSVTELPLNGRNPASLVFLAPGAADGSTSPGVYIQGCCTLPSETEATMSGSRMGEVLYLLNGASNMDPHEFIAGPFPNPEATAEFQVMSNNYGPQYGFSSGGVVQIVTKSGTNSLHGNAFEFLRNQDLNAASYYGHVADPLKRNQFGGSLGGRIIKNKLFYFGNFQWTINRTGASGITDYVPSNAMLNGDFSALLTEGIQLYQANGQPYANNYIDPSTFSGISKHVFEDYPRTTSPFGFINLPNIQLNNRYIEGTAKVDWYPTEKNHVSINAFVQNYLRPGSDGGGDLLLEAQSDFMQYQTYSGNWVRNLAPNLLNSFVFALNHDHIVVLGNQIGADGQPVSYPLYGMQIPDFNQYRPAIMCADLIDCGNAGIILRSEWNLADSVTWTKGRHLMVFGVDILHNNEFSGGDYLSRPYTVFNGQYTGYNYADWLLGDLFEFIQAGGSLGTARGTEYGFYASDAFRVKPNLTVNLGLRWEPFFPPVMDGNRMTLWRPGEQSTVFPNSPVGMVYPEDPGVPRGAMRNELQNVEPRIGLAWQPKALPNTSIRAAFGIFVQPIDYAGYSHADLGAPFSPEYNLIGGPGRGDFLNFVQPYSNVASTGGVSPFPSIFPWPPAAPHKDSPFLPPFAIPSDFAADLTQGKVQSWNLAVEHQFSSNLLLRAAYVGNELFHLQDPVDKNPGFYSAGGARILYPNFGDILSNVSWGTASYNALQLTLEKRFSRGFQYTSNFTYSKNLDESAYASTAWVGSVADPFNLRWSRGISDLSFPYIWSNQGVYKLPGLTQFNKFVSNVLGGWELSGIFVLNAGPPFSIGGGNGNDNSLSLEGGDRADLTGQPFNEHQGSKSQWLQQYFNKAAFTQNAPGTFGDSARNIFRAPRMNNIDMAIMKNFPFKERYNVQFRWEMYNAFNYVQFGGPDNSPTDPTFGQISSQANANRVMQGALKLTF
jgi:hypothetical protein